ncbi:hypothetical protein DFJ77DRAFT_469220 [Powellomyces hirtus]|nr:hypothetical protein DFJ77DRAFT_469220 [Powellomyces hirtus]
MQALTSPSGLAYTTQQQQMSPFGDRRGPHLATTTQRQPSRRDSSDDEDEEDQSKGRHKEEDEEEEDGDGDGMGAGVCKDEDEDDMMQALSCGMRGLGIDGPGGGATPVMTRQQQQQQGVPPAFGTAATPTVSLLATLAPQVLPPIGMTPFNRGNSLALFPPNVTGRNLFGAFGEEDFDDWLGDDTLPPSPTMKFAQETSNVRDSPLDLPRAAEPVASNGSVHEAGVQNGSDSMEVERADGGQHSAVSAPVTQDSSPARHTPMATAPTPFSTRSTGIRNPISTPTPQQPLRSRAPVFRFGATNRTSAASSPAAAARPPLATSAYVARSTAGHTPKRTTQNMRASTRRASPTKPHKRPEYNVDVTITVPPAVESSSHMWANSATSSSSSLHTTPRASHTELHLQQHSFPSASRLAPPSPLKDMAANYAAQLKRKTVVEQNTPGVPPSPGPEEQKATKFARGMSKLPLMQGSSRIPARIPRPAPRSQLTTPVPSSPARPSPMPIRLATTASPAQRLRAYR